MKKTNDKLINKIYKASKDGHLIFFIGAGASVNEGLPNWNGYVNGLLNFWKRRLESDKKISAGRKIINIDEIIENKRIEKVEKIEILYRLIKDLYGEEYFYSHLLDYEKENLVIKEEGARDDSLYFGLAELDAAYFTTNYDNVIETYLQKFRNNYRSYVDVNDFIDNKYELTANTVFHLHGSIFGNPRDFISSKESYDSHYHAKGAIMNKIKNLIKSGEYLIVFIGSSMSEPDVLSLLEGSKNSHIAFLKCKDEDERKEKEDKLNQYNISVYGYKESHDLLPKILQSHIEAEYSQNDSLKKIDQMRFKNNSLPEKEILNIINRNEKNLNVFYRELKGDRLIKRLHDLIRSELFNSGNISISGYIWQLIYININDFSYEEKKNIISNIINGNNNSYMSNMSLNVIRALNLTSYQLDKFYRNISKKINIEYSPYMESYILAGWTMVRNFIKMDVFNYFEEEHLISQNRNYILSEDATDILMKEVNNCFELSDKLNNFSDESILNTKFCILYNLIKNEKIKPNKKMLDNEHVKKLLKIEHIPIVSGCNINECSFVSEEDIFSMDFLDNILKEDRKLFIDGNLVEQNCKSTALFLIDIIKKNNHSSKKIIEKFSENVILLFEKYKSVYAFLLEQENINDFYSDYIDCIVNFYKNFEKIQFSSLDYRIWNKIIKLDSENEYVDVFMSLSINENKSDDYLFYQQTLDSCYYIKLCRNLKISNKILEEDFINAIKKLNKNTCNTFLGFYSSKLDNHLKDNPYYLIGLMYSPLLNDFIKNSIFINGIYRVAYLFYLTIRDNDDYKNLNARLLSVLSCRYNPYKLLVKNNWLFKNIWYRIFNFKFSYVYDSEWIKFIIRNNSDSIYNIMNLLYKGNMINFIKVKSNWNEIMIALENQKEQRNFINTYSVDEFNDLSDERKRIVKLLYTLLFKRNLVNHIDFDFVENLLKCSEDRGNNLIILNSLRSIMDEKQYDLLANKFYKIH